MGVVVSFVPWERFPAPIEYEACWALELYARWREQEISYPWRELKPGHPEYNIYDIHFLSIIIVTDRLCGLVIRVPGYRREMYCDSSEVRTEFIYVM
jgi:hypothetical protein